MPLEECQGILYDDMREKDRIARNLTYRKRTERTLDKVDIWRRAKRSETENEYGKAEENMCVQFGLRHQ